MKKISLLFIFLFSIIESRSQNLVPNPDFEDTLVCPLGPACIYCADHWNSCLGSPDYFNTCALSCLPPQTCSGIPNNWAGTQNAFSGGAYSGLGTAGYGGLIREIQIVQLIEPLEIGKKYFMSCYISRAYSDEGHGASNNFGFRFSTVEFDPFNEVPIDNFSHYRDTTIITDTTNWTRIEGSFTADSSYGFLMLGNFYDDNNTDTIDMMPTTAPWNAAYYYVDDVCVTPDSGNCSVINSIRTDIKEVFKVYPNPCNDRLFFSSGTEKDFFTFELFDSFGRLVLKKDINDRSSIDVSILATGIYFYSIGNLHEQLRRGKILKK